MRCLLFFLLFVMSFSAFARDRLLLITSFEQPATQKFSFNKKRKFLHFGVESIFKKKLRRSGYELEVIHDADPHELFTLVRSGDYKGIFWISHANKGAALGEGISSGNLILDKNHVNVKDIFHHLHPETDFLGLIGCYSQDFASELNKGSTTIVGFDKKVDILQGLRKSIKRFKRLSLQDSGPELLPPLKLSLHIERSSHETNLPALFVYNRGKLVSVLPPLWSHTAETYELKIDEVKSLNDLKIVFSTEKMLHQNQTSDAFGSIGINSKAGVFEMMTVNGRPLGTRTRIFKYQGELPLPINQQKDME